MKKTLILSLAILTLSACATTRHYVNGTSIQGTRKVQSDSNYFISGLGQKEHIAAAKACGGAQRVVATETRMSPLNNVLSIVSFGIYTPQEQTIYCR